MATTIIYPAALPCPVTAGNDMPGGQTFDRTEFDYDTRQRARYCSSYMVKFSFVCRDKAQMKAFKDFYYITLGLGAQSFLASWEVEGDVTEKEFRFSARYRPKSLGAGYYSISGEFEMLTPIKDL